MGLKKTDKIWIDGEMVNWDDAKEHVLAHSLHYGLGAFEGIRSYKTSAGNPAIFRLDDHIDRLLESCHIATIEPRFPKKALFDACVDTIRINKLTDAYIRPLIYLGYGALGLGTFEPPVRSIVAAFEWGAYLGEDGLKKGIRCAVSSYRRAAVDAVMSKGKLSGQYTTSILAKREALNNGFDEAILLDAEGRVAEGSGENIFIVKNGRIRTPPTSAAILAGITRDTVITLAHELGIAVDEQSSTRDELWTADEVFFSGTAAEVTPVREIDRRQIGSGEPGPVTRRIQERFFAVVRGDVPEKSNWLTAV